MARPWLSLGQPEAPLRFLKSTKTEGKRSFFEIGTMSAHVSILEPCWLQFGHLGPTLPLHVGSILAPTWPCWPLLGHLNFLLDSCWGVLDHPWAMLAPSWLQCGHLGRILALMVAILRPCWLHLGSIWVILMPRWVHVGCNLDRTDVCQLDSSCACCFF